MNSSFIFVKVNMINTRGLNYCVIRFILMACGCWDSTQVLNSSTAPTYRTFWSEGWLKWDGKKYLRWKIEIKYNLNNLVLVCVYFSTTKCEIYFCEIYLFSTKNGNLSCCKWVWTSWTLFRVNTDNEWQVCWTQSGI